MPDVIPETPAIETADVAQPVEESTSLADHERDYGSDRDPAPRETVVAESAAAVEGEETTAERDEKGQFKPRHRAKSQEASPGDVPRIRELTKRLRDAEAERDALRQTRQPAVEPVRDTARETLPIPSQPKASGTSFPTFDQFLALPDHKDKTFEDFLDARSDWHYERRRNAERADEARTTAARAEHGELRTYLDQIPATLKKYPDFDDIVNPGGQPIRVSKVVERAVIRVGPDVAYYLATHPEERDALNEETAIDPQNPAFAATVAAMTRYLRTLVAPEQRPSASPSRAAAAATGSALALVTPPAPRPPNPVRTAGLRDGEALPADESSLADHERAFAPGRRRA